MLVENTEALKKWLSVTLEPLCDADPVALSKYVLALIKKDKPLEELRESMEAQMDVFLQTETKAFIDVLFAALDSKSYLNAPDSSSVVGAAAEPAGPDPAGGGGGGPAETQLLAPDAVAEETSDHWKTSAAAVDGPNGTAAAKPKEPSRDRHQGVKKAAEPEEHRGPRSSGGRLGRDRRSPPPPPLSGMQQMPASRRHHDSRKRSRSPPAMGRRFMEASSPPPSYGGSGGRRRRGRSRSRSRSISPLPHSRRRGGSPSPMSLLSAAVHRNRGRSRSPLGLSSLMGRDDTYIPSSLVRGSGGGGGSSSALKTLMRCRDYDEKGFCMKGDQCTFDHGSDAVILEDSSLAAYNPTTDTSVPPPPLLVGPGGGGAFAEPYVPLDVAGSLPPVHLPPPGFGGNSMPPMPSLQLPPPMPPPMQHGMKRGPPDSGGMYGQPPPAKRFDFNRLGPGGPGGPVVSFRGRGGPMLRGRGFRGMRAAVPQNELMMSAGTTTQIAVRNIPPSLNNIGLLNSHFGRFGNLVNVQVHFEGDPASALVSYSTPQEAEVAMNCPEPVLANRYIRLFYYQEKPKTNIRDRLGDIVEPQPHHKQLPNAVGVPGQDEANNRAGSAPSVADQEAESKKQAEIEQQKAAAIAAIKKNQEVLETKAQIKKEAEAKRLEVVKQVQDLRQSKQELLEKLLLEQKNIIAKIEEKKATLKPEERKEMLDLAKSLSGSISKTKEDLQKLLQRTAAKKTAGEVQKELLDAELELMSAQHDGSDPTEIQKRINSLTIEAAKFGILPTSKLPSPRGGRGGGGGGYLYRGVPLRGSSPYGGRGRGFRGTWLRGSPRGGAAGAVHQTSLDRRPTKLKVRGFDPDDKEAIISHFKRLGSVVDALDHETESDQDSACVIIHFTTRKDAEYALANGSKFGEQPLDVAWYSGQTPSDFKTQTSVESNNGAGPKGEVEAPDDDYTPFDPTYLPPGLIDDDEGKQDADAIKTEEDDLPNELGISDDILAEEEEEDEEDEERSWKR